MSRTKLNHRHSLWNKGLVTSRSPLLLEAGEATTAINVDIATPGVLSRRLGWGVFPDLPTFGGAPNNVNGLFNMYLSGFERPVGHQTIYYNRLVAVIGDHLWESDENDLLPSQGLSTWTQITAATELVGFASLNKVRPMFVQLVGKLYIALGVGGQGGFDGGVDSPKIRSWDSATFDEVAASPESSIIEAYQGNLVAAGNLDQPNRVYFSGVAGISGPDVWPALNFVDLEAGDGDRIMGLSGIHNMLVVLKRRSIWRISGVFPDDAALDDGSASAVQLNGEQAGCYAPRTVVSNGERVLWLGRDGIYSFNGQSVKELTKDIREIFVNRNGLRLWGGDGDLDSTGYLVTPTDYVCFFGYPAPYIRLGIHINLDTGAIALISGNKATATAYTFRNDHSIYGFPGGLIGIENQVYSDNGVPIEWVYRTGQINIGPLNELKITRFASILAKPTTEGVTIQAIEDLKDTSNKGKVSVDLTDPLNRPFITRRKNLTNMGRVFQLEIKGDGTDILQKPEIHEIVLEYERKSL